MTGIFEQILDLFRRNEIVVSNHGYEELSEDNIGLTKADDFTPALSYAIFE